MYIRFRRTTSWSGRLRRTLSFVVLRLEIASTIYRQRSARTLKHSKKSNIMQEDNGKNLEWPEVKLGIPASERISHRTKRIQKPPRAYLLRRREFGGQH